MKRALALVLATSLLWAATSYAQVPEPQCDGEQRCARKLVSTIEKLSTCQEQLLKAQATPPPVPTQIQATVEYKTPTAIWVLLGIALAASTVLGVYTVVSANSALDRIR